MIPHNDAIYKMISQWISKTTDEITIRISSHEIPIYRGLSTTPTIKYVYSKDFLSVIHYIMNYCLDDIHSITEIITDCKDLCNYYDDNKKDEYFYIPLSSKKICICREQNIYCELNVVEGDSDKDSNQDSSSKMKPAKKHSYMLILSTPFLAGNIVCLKDFIHKCREIYEKSKNKNDCNKRHIFVYEKSEKSESNTELFFTKYPMEHNKDLNHNIFFEGKDKLIQYIHPFIYDPDETFNIGEEKYKRSGFTFKAGLLFYGAPGCGKTSTIKAILKYTNRHAVILNMNRIKSCEELESIFRKRIFNEKEIGGKELCYILEDCDATGDIGILSTRNNKSVDYSKKKEESSKTHNESENIMNKLIELSTATCIVKPEEDPLNLSCFLNILDGIIELYGVMIIMTTNYPEKIDDALIRPGRFDFKYEFKRSSHKIIREMLKFKYEISEETMCEYDPLLHIKDEILSPAQIQAICFQNPNIEDCIHEIVSIGQKA